jgi:hypothetical protein
MEQYVLSGFVAHNHLEGRFSFVHSMDRASLFLLFSPGKMLA